MDFLIMRKGREECGKSGNKKTRETDTYAERKKAKEVLRATFNSADSLVCATSL
jgi:hypothetical protein